MNRDTQDALAHLSRLLHCSIKDLGVAGTKDKRGVTIQRVSLRRNRKTLDDVWKMVNNVPGRRTAEEAVTTRGERGVRIGDLEYRKAGLELGMLKGNTFIITLRRGYLDIPAMNVALICELPRNVKAESEDALNRSMELIKQKGFINYYGTIFRSVIAVV